MCCQLEDFGSSDSDTDEPSCEALARYLAIRRHTVGVGDTKHEVLDDVRLKLMHQQQLLSDVHHPPGTMFNPARGLPHTNLPQHLPLFHNPALEVLSYTDAGLLKPPQLLSFGVLEFLFDAHTPYMYIHARMLTHIHTHTQTDKQIGRYSCETNSVDCCLSNLVS